jgi:protein TonB
MSRHARHDIDLSALPTVADVDDDDLIDRDEKWHEFQRSREAAKAPEPEIPEPEPVWHAPEQQVDVVHEPEPVPEASIVEEPPPAPPEEIRLIDIQPPRALETMEEPVVEDAPEETIPVPKPAAPAKTKLRESKPKAETPPVSFGTKKEEPSSRQNPRPSRRSRSPPKKSAAAGGRTGRQKSVPARSA